MNIIASANDSNTLGVPGLTPSRLRAPAGVGVASEIGLPQDALSLSPD